MNVGDDMAILCLVSNNSNKERIELFRGPLWLVDQYTTQFEDSNQLVKESVSYEDISRLKRPYSSSIEIKIFDGTEELDVFYKMHSAVFSKVIKDLDFMNYYFQNSQSNAFLFSKEEVEYYLLQVSSYAENFFKDMNQKTNEEEMSQYFDFMRDVLTSYEKYSHENKDVQTMQCIYEEICWHQIHDDFDFSSEEADMSFENDREPDYYLEEEPKYHLLEEFLGNPNFERYYGGAFSDAILLILGNSSLEYPCQEIYQEWYEYAESGFPGTIKCPKIKNNLPWEKQFNEAAIAYFLVFKKDFKLEKLISLALLNGTNVVIQVYDVSLYERYMKKYPKATILPFENQDQMVDGMDRFMISCYNRAKEKWYKK